MIVRGICEFSFHFLRSSKFVNFEIIDFNMNLNNENETIQIMSKIIPKSRTRKMKKQKKRIYKEKPVERIQDLFSECCTQNKKVVIINNVKQT